ncbi:Lrp/AsnC family transcriptional regulator [Kitasatospora sp. NPDC089509]|uniref:Lrp/AsnC family transcriptional regulator n=1 Tax=Kitasatospora sp. NPDC089509 TaxID=3364079 RepID=UPI00382DF6DD
MIELDALDQGLVHALHLDGRVPFSRVAEALGSSEQTIARRYRRLRAEAGLRVVGLPVPERVGGSQWMVRLTTAPAATRNLAEALARRPDTSWVQLISGGTEVSAVLTTPGAGESSPSLLLHDLPRKAGITAVSAYCLLHTYLGGPTAWPGRLHGLDERQCELIRPSDGVPGGADTGAGTGTGTAAGAPVGGAEPFPSTVPRPLVGAESALVAALGRDGRASYAELASSTGLSQATVARRLAGLRADGALFFDVDLSSTVLGVSAQALLWLAVAPDRLDGVARAMAGHPELAAVFATTGRTNLMAKALCDSPAELHRYLTGRLSAIDGIQSLETAPVLQRVKGVGPHWAAGRVG